MTTTIAQEIASIIGPEWADIITFDFKKAETKGVVVLQYRTTGADMFLNVRLTQEALEKGRINLREVRRKIKENLPELVVKRLTSEVNSLLRDANRRTLRDVSRDLDEWLKKTSSHLKRMYGREVAEEFSSEVPLPNHIKPGSIQGIQYVVETKIDFLKNL